MTPFINIHSHKLSHKWSIQNIDQRDFSIPENLFSIGIHPWFLSPSNYENDSQILEKMLPNAIAIGECGLDKVCDVPWELQKEAFVFQIQLSEKYRKPLVIHCVKAYNDIIELKKTLKPEMPWIVHGFNKKSILLEKLIREGFYISLGKKVVQNENWVKSISKILPLEKLFFETDDSEISIEAVYLAFSKYSGTDMDGLKSQIFLNFNKTFQVIGK